MILTQVLIGTAIVVVGWSAVIIASILLGRAWPKRFRRLSPRQTPPWALRFGRAQSLAMQLEDIGFREVGCRDWRSGLWRTSGRVFHNADQSAYSILYGTPFLGHGTTMLSTLSDGTIVQTFDNGPVWDGPGVLQQGVASGDVAAIAMHHASKVQQLGAYLDDPLPASTAGTVQELIDIEWREISARFGNVYDATGRHHIDLFARAPRSLVVSHGLHWVEVELSHRYRGPWPTYAAAMLALAGLVATQLFGIVWIWVAIVGIATMRLLRTPLRVVVSQGRLDVDRAWGVKPVSIALPLLSEAKVVANALVIMVRSDSGKEVVHRLGQFGTEEEQRWLIELIRLARGEASGNSTHKHDPPKSLLEILHQAPRASE